MIEFIFMCVIKLWAVLLSLILLYFGLHLLHAIYHDTKAWIIKHITERKYRPEHE